MIGLAYFVQLTWWLWNVDENCFCIQSYGCFALFWKIEDVESHSKCFIFMEIMVNLYFWRCISWVLKDSLVKSLNVLVRRSARRILGINMIDVKQLHIRNSETRYVFYNFPFTHRLITSRQLNLLEKYLGTQEIKSRYNHPRAGVIIRGNPDVACATIGNPS